MTSLKKPAYPLTVMFPDGETEVFDDEDHAVCNLEFFDSDNPKHTKAVLDALNRSVRLKIDKGRLVWCELIE